MLLVSNLYVFSVHFAETAGLVFETGPTFSRGYVILRTGLVTI